MIGLGAAVEFQVGELIVVEVETIVKVIIVAVADMEWEVLGATVAVHIATPGKRTYLDANLFCGINFCAFIYMP